MLCEFISIILYFLYYYIFHCFLLIDFRAVQTPSTQLKMRQFNIFKRAVFENDHVLIITTVTSVWCTQAFSSKDQETCFTLSHPSPRFSDMSHSTDMKSAHASYFAFIIFKRKESNSVSWYLKCLLFSSILVGLSIKLIILKESAFVLCFTENFVTG